MATRTRSRLGALAAAGLLALSAAACSSEAAETDGASVDAPFETVTAGTITVGVPTFPPFSGIEDGRIVGPDGEVVYEIAEHYGLEVVAEPYEFSALIPAVQQGRIDVAIGSIFRTTERDKVIDFTDPIYIEPGSFIAKDDISSVDDLKGKRVGTIQGYNWVEDVDRELGGELAQYPSSVELKQDLEAGRLDVGIDSYGTALYLYEGTEFQVKVLPPDERIAAATNPGQVGFVVKTGSTDLTEAFNDVIATLHEEDAIAPILEGAGLDPSAAKVGEPRYL
jgi:polar amino acid transport system substrate-binding protein